MANIFNLKTGAAAIALATAYLLSGAASNPALACSGDETYLGSICSFAGNYCPENYMKAEGQLLTISEYSALYALLGTNFGGNGTTNFALPDLRGRTPVGLGTAYSTTVNMGTKRGVETTQLTSAQLTAHNHQAQMSGGGGQQLATVKVSKTSADVETPGSGDYLATPAYESFVSASGKETTVELAGGSLGSAISGPLQVQNAGNNAVFSILTPYQAATYCIRTEGLFPPRDN